MAGRKKKTGIEFSGWDVDVFEDPKVERLIDKGGAMAFLVFFAVCQRAYLTSGYYLPWTAEDAPAIRRVLGGGVDSQCVVAAVDLCLEVGLFSEAIFLEHGVLTSRKMQINYAVVLSRRRRKEVAKEYWLLPPEDSNGAVPVPLSET